MKAAAGFLFFLKSPFVLFLFCIIDHKLADFEKKKNFVVTSLQNQHFTGFRTTPGGPCFLPVPNFLKTEKGSSNGVSIC